MAFTYGYLGLIYCARGDLKEAEQLLRESLEIEERMGRSERMASAFSDLGLIHQRGGNLEEAERMLRNCLELFQRVGARDSAARVSAMLSDLATEQGD